MLRVLTYNVCCQGVSSKAPWGFDPQRKHQEVVALIGQHEPDLVSLQEVVNTKWALGANMLLEGLSELGYELAAGFSPNQVYVQKGLGAFGGRATDAAAICQIPLPLPLDGGGAGGRSTCFYFVGCHMMHGHGNEDVRLQQMRDLMSELPPRCRLVLAGDCNLREHEDLTVEALGLQDAFHQLGSPAHAQYTWDSYRNRYHEGGPPPFVHRFDRVYLRGFEATSMSILADQEVHPGCGDCLRDHFALLSTVKLQPGQL